MCCSREQDLTRKGRAAELPCGDTMTLAMKVYFYTPPDSGQDTFNKCVTEEDIPLGNEGGQQGEGRSWNSPQFPGGPQESVRESTSAHRKPLQLHSRQEGTEKPTLGGASI